MARFVDLSTRSVQHEELDQEAVDLTPALEEITEQMFEAEAVEKKVKQERSKLRSEFFALLTEHVRQHRPLATQVIELSLEESGESVDDVKAVIARHYPEWQIINVTRDAEGWSVQIQEDPSIAKATFANRKLGKVFGRTFELRGGGFDAAGLVEAYPDLAELCVHRIETRRFVAGEWEGDPEISVSYEFDEDLATKIVGLDPSTLPIFQQFTVLGKLNTKLMPTREFKEDDEA